MTEIVHEMKNKSSYELQYFPKKEHRCAFFIVTFYLVLEIFSF